MQIQAEILCVSQFTLYAKLKGAKPDFHMAAGAAVALPLYNAFVSRLRSEYAADKVQTGVFGAMMAVEILNDGPVTLIIDSNAREPMGKGDAATASHAQIRGAEVEHS